MSCIITLKINGLSIKYTTSLESEQINLENIAKEITNKSLTYTRNSNAKSEGNIPKLLADYLSKAKSIEDGKKGIKSILKKALEGETGALVGNYSLDNLASRFPNVKFDGLELDENEEIFYTKSLSYEGLGLAGKITIGEKSLFIVTNQYDALTLANYLKTRTKLSDSKLDLSSLINPSVSTALKFIKGKTKLKTDEAALRYFFNNSDKFIYSIKDNIDIYTTLSDFIKDKINESYTRQELENPVANSIMHRSRYINGSYFLTQTQAQEILKMFNVENDLVWKAVKEDKKNGILKVEKSTNKQISSFFEQLMTDAGHPVKVEITKNDFIRIYSPYQTFRDLNIAYDSMKLAQQVKVKENLFDYKIFNLDGKFYVSKDKQLTLDSHAQPFATNGEALNYIRERLKRTTIGQGFRRALLNFSFDVKGIQSVSLLDTFNPAVNTVFEAINYPIDPAAKITDIISSKLLPYLNMNLQSMINEFEDTYEVDMSPINTYEKALAFLVELSKHKVIKNNTVKSTIKTIADLETKEFLVVDKSNFGTSHRLLITDVGEEQEENKTEIKTPVIVPLKNLAYQINSKYQVVNKTDRELVKIITTADIDNGDYNLPNTINRTASGFIYDGVIYINATYAHMDDLTHEMGHLLLGMMKATDMNTYMQLINKVAETSEIIRLKKKKAELIEYANLSDEDLTEEAFVDLFSGYMRRNNKTLGVLENTVRKKLTDSISKFGTFLEGARTLSDIFDNFNTATKNYLYQGTGLELNTAAASYRRAANFIREELSKTDSKIEKICEG